MAELDSDQHFLFAAAASAVALSTGKRLARNFSYYRSSGRHTILRDELETLCRSIRRQVFSLSNLIRRDARFSPFWVSIAGEINDRLEELHRKLLFFDPARITEPVQIIDEQRTFWKEMTDPEFYGENLALRLETDIPQKLQETEELISGLPESVTF
jgi:hypothetical protein